MAGPEQTNRNSSKGTEGKHAASKTSSQFTIPKGSKCDLCEKHDGFHKKHFLQRCKDCGLCVHETCYGLVPAVPTGAKNPNFQCVACAAVGKDIVVSREMDGPHKKTMRQMERPRECALCSINDGNHAMHPLYDIEGPDGRHRVLPEDKKRGLPKRLAWVHSLCANFIASMKMTAGCVWGEVDQQESDDEDDEEEEFEDDGSSSESSVSSTSESDDASVSRPKKRKRKVKSKNSKSTKKQRTDRQDGRKGQKRRRSDGDEKKSDASDDDADDEGEGDGEDSQIAAVHHFLIAEKENGKHTDWSKRIAECRETLTCSICGIHDKHNTLRIPVQCVAGDRYEFEEFREKHPDLESTCFVPMHVGCAMWGLNDDGEKPPHRRVYFYPGTQDDDKFNEPITCCYCDAHAKDIYKDEYKGNPKKQTKVVNKWKKPIDRRSGHHRQDGRKPLARAAVPTGLSRRQSAPVVSKRGSVSANAKEGNMQRRVSEQATTAVAKATLARASTDSALVARKNKVKKRDWFPLVRDDVISAIRSAKAKNGGKSTVEVTNARKDYWRLKSGLPKPEFKELWNRVKGDVVSAMAEEKAVSSRGSTSERSESTAPGSIRPSAGSTRRASVEGPNVPNHWSSFWVPGYHGEEFAFGEFDVCKETQPIDM